MERKYVESARWEEEDVEDAVIITFPSIILMRI